MTEPLQPESPNPIPGATVWDIRRACGDAQAKILTALFYLPQAAAFVDVHLRPEEVQEARGGEELNHIVMAKREAWAGEIRRQLKEQYIEEEVQMVMAVAERVEYLNDFLEPKHMDSAAYVQAMTATEDQVIAMFDGVAAWESESADDVAKMLWKVALEREMQGAIARMVDVREDFMQAFSELQESEQDPDILDPADRFETLAPPAPTKQQIFSSSGDKYRGLDALAMITG